MIHTILPTPKKTEVFEGITYVKAAIFTDYAPFAAHLSAFADAAEKIHDTSVAIANGGIRVEYNAALAENAYIFDSREGIVVRASAVQGLMYGLSTALHVVESCEGGFQCEKACIEDHPDKEYRGLMVDLARCWHPAKQVLRFIDLCFALKIRHLHLHFVDDQLYTLPSKAFPNLPGKRHYSFDDIAAVCEYAKLRGVILIPEFEAPGHSKQLNLKYPEIFANNIENKDEAILVAEGGQVINADSLVCAGKTETMEAIRTLLAEICEMFPDSPYIHIGGDEANIKAWNLCPDCVKYMKDHGLTGEKELYSEFIARVTQAVLDLGRTPIVWEGFPKVGAERIPRETIVIAWESHYHLVHDLLEEGFRVINSSWQPLYIVDNLDLKWGPKELLAWNTYNWQHWWPESYACANPIQLAPTDQVLGAQLSIWECTYEREINTAMHNATTLSERLWAVDQKWDDFSAYHKRHGAMISRIARLIAEV
ncbi:MAG: family 20 glycosylhydrolase [Oscillospiraceae bacterium]|nr:family 20 glycosylhydrolase [Oscillospiraceae bacterium]